MSKSIIEQVKAYPNFWGDKSYIDIYREIKLKEKLAAHFKNPIADISSSTDYKSIDKPFSFTYDGRKYDVAIKTEIDQYASMIDYFGESGMFEDRLDWEVKHSIQNNGIRRDHRDREEKYYVPSYYVVRDEKKRIYYSNKGFYELIKFFNKTYSKHNAFLQAIACMQEEYQSYCDYWNGDIALYCVDVAISVNGVELGFASICGCHISYSDFDEQVEVCVWEYDLIQEAFVEAQKTLEGLLVKNC